MANNPWDDADAISMERVRAKEKAADRFATATRSMLVAAVQSFMREQKTSYRDALAYAENTYRGDWADSVVLAEAIVPEICAYWESILTKSQRTINRPDRMLVTGVIALPEIVSHSAIQGTLLATIPRLMQGLRGNGFRVARSLYDTAMLVTGFCVLCHSTTGPTSLVNRTRNKSRIGLLWFNTHQADTLASITSDAQAHGVFGSSEAAKRYCQVAGICEGGCPIECVRCNRPVNLNYDSVEIGTLRQEKVCRACAKYSLALVEPPKFSKGELRKLNKNLRNLVGGVAE